MPDLEIRESHGIGKGLIKTTFDNSIGIRVDPDDKIVQHMELGRIDTFVDGAFMRLEITLILHVRNDTHDLFIVDDLPNGFLAAK